MTDTPACKALLASMQAGGKVSIKQLERVLGQKHWRWFSAERDWAKTQRERVEIARYELRDYIRLVHLADLYEGQSGRRGKRSGAHHRLKHGTDSKYELALECLSELIGANPRLIEYLDRHPDMDNVGGNVHADRELVPRVISSKRRVYGNVENKLITTLVELKEVALTLALQDPQTEIEVEREAELMSDEQQAQMQNLIKLARGR